MTAGQEGWTPAGGQPHVEAHAIDKRFGGVQALHGIDLAIQPGTVHALVGENGAGKSTLGKIICGVLRPDGGELRVDGRPVDYASPRAALADGITMIQQEVALVPKLSVLENVFLGIESNRSGVLQDGDTRRRFAELNATSGFDLPADTPVGRLSVAEQKKVEILKAVRGEPVPKSVKNDEQKPPLPPDGPIITQKNVDQFKPQW